MKNRLSFLRVSWIAPVFAPAISVQFTIGFGMDRTPTGVPSLSPGLPAIGGLRPPEGDVYPNGVAPAWRYGRRNPVGVETVRMRLTQGRSLAATNPGLWDETPLGYARANLANACGEQRRNIVSRRYTEWCRTITHLAVIAIGTGRASCSLWPDGSARSTTNRLRARSRASNTANCCYRIRPIHPTSVVRIPLAEIMDITLRPTAAAAQAGTARSTAAVASLSAIGSFFGLGGSAQTAPPTEASAPVPAAAPSNDPFGNDSPAPVSSVPQSAPAPAPVVLRRTLVHDSGQPVWEIEFAGGDHAMASLDRWAADRVALRIDSLAKQSLEVPVDRLRTIWSTNEALVKKAKDLNETAAGQDIAFVEKNGEVKSVAGVAAGIDGGFLKFKFEGEERRIKLDRVVGILLAQREAAPETSLFEAFNLVDGDVLSGRIESIDKGVLRLKPLYSSGDEQSHFDIPLKELASIDVKNGRLTWIGDLQPAAVSQVPYFDRLMQYRVNQSLTGGDLVLADGPVTKGIAVHTKCGLTYDIGGAFERLRAKIGFQQPEGKAGRAAVRIVGDGKVLWKWPTIMRRCAASDQVDVSVAKIKSLSLEADYGSNFDVAGRVVWGEARLVRGPK